MKRCMLGLFILGCGFLGCNGPNSRGNLKELPDFLEGVWEARRPRKPTWGIKLERDGSISKMIHPIAGQVKMSEGSSYEEGPVEGTFALAIMGPCQAQYDPTTRILRISLQVEYFHMKLPQGDLEGRTEDYFEGPVSEDGKTWQAKWRSYNYLKGAQDPDKEAIDANPEELTFQKLDLSQMKPES